MSDASDLKAAIGEHLDKMEATVNWVVGIGFLAFISGVAGSNGEANSTDVSLFSLAVSRERAFVVLSIAFLYATAVLWVYFSRLLDLLIKIRKSGRDAIGMLSVFQLHSWYLNPFALFGKGKQVAWRDRIGYPAMIVAWWLGFATLASIITLKYIRQDGERALLLGGGLLVFGAAGWAANLIMFRVLVVFDGLLIDLSGSTERYASQRRLRSALIGNVLGAAFAAGMVAWANINS